MRAALHARFTTEKQRVLDDCEGRLSARVCVMAALLIGAVLFAAPVRAGFVSEEQLCRDGDRDACRVIELGKKIDKSQFAEGARYKLAMGPQMLASITPHDADERRRLTQQAACTFYSEVWLGDQVEEYARLQGLRPIDRAMFDRCMASLRS
jgi:hypothetical protein